MTDERMPPQVPHVEAFLESLAAVAVPGELAGAVSSHLRERPSRRPSLRLPLLAASAGLLLTVGVAMAVGWEPPFDILPGPQATASLSLPSPSASANPETPAPADAWEWATIVGQGAEIVADPAVPDAIGVTPGYSGGNLVLVLGRRVVNGRTWVRVEEGGYGWDARFVWIPETIPSVAPAGYHVNVLERTRHLPCYTGEPPTIESLASMTAALRLACHGAGAFTIGPVQVVRSWDSPRNAGAPAWLAGEMTTMLEGPRRSDGLVMTVPVHVDPALGITLPANAWVRVTLHLDDPAAAICTRQTTAADRPVGEPSDQVLWCRQQLVVTGYDEVPAPTPVPPSPAPYPTLDGVRSPLPDAPIDGRVEESATWTGSELVIWGGEHRAEAPSASNPPADGAALDVESGTWDVMAPSPLGGRSSPLSAWTGTEVLFWGGLSTERDRWLADGAAWNPATDTWRMLPKSPLKGGFPQVAAWSGDRWYVASGKGLAAYDPATASWRPEADLPIGADDIVRLAWAGDRLALLTQTLSGAELWTMRPGEVWVSRAPPPLVDVPGDGMVFGGGRLWIIGAVPQDAADGLAAGLQAIAWWDPASGTWPEVIDAPVVTQKAAAVWSGSQLVVAGELGAAFDPAVGTWFMLPEGGNDRFREEPSVVWAGDRLIVWGGGFGEIVYTRPDGWQLVWAGS